MEMKKKMKLPRAHAQGIFSPSFVGSKIPPKQKSLRIHPRTHVRGFLRRGITALIIAIILFVLLYSAFLYVGKLLTPKKVHYHAGFVVFENDKKKDFSDFKYMRIKPCLLDQNQKDSKEDIQAEKAHLHDSVGDVVHIEGENALWRDLFQNIRYKLDYSKAFTFINGSKVKNFENQKIQPYDSIVILIGSNKSNHLQDAVPKNYIEEKAAKSVDCGD